MNYRNRILAILALSLFFSGAKAQLQPLPNYLIPNIEDLVKIPPSPEAQAFQKYGNTAMNFYTGSTNVSIPVATLRGREIEVPISLTYDASGIKVEQISTWVGLGWNLNAGGMVTRNNNGNPDDYITASPTYYPFYSPTVNADYELARALNPNASSFPAGNLSRYFNFMLNVTQPSSYKTELQPDTYSFNVMGLSGTVYIDYTKDSAYCIEHPEISVVPTFLVTGAASQKVITAWYITDQHGNQYAFTLAEVTYSNDMNAQDNFIQYNSSWMLTSIQSKNIRDIITFNYNTIPQWTQPQLAGRGDSRLDVTGEGGQYGNDIVTTPPIPQYTISQSDLTSITMNGITVANFATSATSRLDLTGRKALVEIDILDPSGTGQIVSIFKLRQSYFGAGDQMALRLRLDAVELHGAATQTHPQQYSFVYNSGDMPARNSYSQDFWGYNNGMDNATLIPYNYAQDVENSLVSGFSGGNRNPNLSAAIVGTLSTITYPTGGSTQFTYDMNKSRTISYSYQKDLEAGEGSLQGGADAANPYNYCDDAVSTKPKGTEMIFQITQPGMYRVTVTSTGAVTGGPQMQFLSLYSGSTSRDFCNLYGGPTNVPEQPIQLYHSIVPNYSQTMNVWLDAGPYHVLMLNTDTGVTIGILIVGTQTVNNYDAPGLMTTMAADYDENGNLVSKKVYYYDSLTSVPKIHWNEEYLLSHPAISGSLHAIVNFEETKYMQKYLTNGSPGVPQLISYSVLARYSSNRTHSKYQLTYPTVTEIQFNTDGSGPNGFTIYEYSNRPESYTFGFAMETTLNGKLTRKRIFDAQGNMLSKEQDFFHEQWLGGYVGICFTTDTQYEKDLLVKSLITDPTNEFYVIQNPGWGGDNAGVVIENHCADTGWVFNLYAHDKGDEAQTYFNSIVNIYPGAEMFNTNQLQLLNSSGLGDWFNSNNASFVVAYPYYNIIFCNNFKGYKYQKYTYEYPRYWATDDSTTVTQYNGTTALSLTSRNFYDNAKHYQVTRMQTTDSKGVLHTATINYPHEMKVQDPSNPIWPQLIAQHRIAEPITKTGTFGSGSPDFQQITAYRWMYPGVMTRVVPDYIQFSSGSGPLETRIRYWQYDDYANPLEVSRENDTHICYQWGYNSTLPVAEIKNSTLGTFAYTSFENTDGAGWTFTPSLTTVAFKTGSSSQMLTSGSVTRSGLVSSSSYTLSYWAKGGTPSISGGVVSSNDAPAATADGWKYFQKTISGVTSITLSSTGLVYLDELRIYPSSAQMNTHTFKPPIGMTSATDANGVTSSYEYDNYGRLMTVRDCDGYVIKNYVYHYKGDN